MQSEKNITCDIDFKKHDEHSTMYFKSHSYLLKRFYFNTSEKKKKI